MKTAKVYEIEKLYNLKKKGIISNSEFETQKKELLNFNDSEKSNNVYIKWADVFVSYFFTLVCFIPYGTVAEEISNEAGFCIVLITLFISNIIASIIANSRR